MQGYSFFNWFTCRLQTRERGAFDHVTPQVQQLLADKKEFQTRNGFKFCWRKNFIYLQQTADSRPIQFKTLDDLERFPREESLPFG